MAGLGEQDAVEAYEEVKFEPTVMVDKLGPSVTLAAAQLEDGDILVFQRQVGSADWLGGGAGGCWVHGRVYASVLFR